ncbi:hypothetical protein LCGC14_0728830 [marine sediment metagenome]|uniref:LIM zinc-binding domain-containing protein n=1 Tax=marine sediment metagenome TaxID=412755 RepID=A0A0F9SVD4_9ZZZZ
MLCKDCETIIPKALMKTFELCGPCMFKRGYCKNYYSCGRDYNHAIRVHYGSWLCNECYRMFSMPLFTTEVVQDSVINLSKMLMQNLEEYQKNWLKDMDKKKTLNTSRSK